MVHDYFVSHLHFAVEKKKTTEGINGKLALSAWVKLSLCNWSCESITIITLTVLLVTLSPAVRRRAFVVDPVGLVMKYRQEYVAFQGPKLVRVKVQILGLF